MENLINTIMSYEAGFYILLTLNLIYILLKEGRALFAHLTSKTKTTKDDEIVAKIYEVLDKYKLTLDKVSTEVEKNKDKKKTSK